MLSSATPEENLRRIIDARGWSHLFDGVFGLPTSKTETLFRLIDRHGLRPGEVAVVGDGDGDRESAQAVGCAFFPVGEACIGPQERIFTLSALQTILLEA